MGYGGFTARIRFSSPHGMRRVRMSEVLETHLERGRDAAARGDWPQAFDLLMAADADGLWRDP